jgi:hypothetical protein
MSKCNFCDKAIFDYFDTRICNECRKKLSPLFAASPDLLNACKVALKMLKDPNADDYFDGNRLETVLENAIEKAEGREKSSKN